MSNENKKPRKQTLVSIWEHTSKNGLVYLKGSMADGTKVIAFRNSDKKNPREPDWRIVADTPRESQNEDSRTPANDDPF